MFSFDDRTRALLAAIARHGSLAAGAHAVGMDTSNARRHLVAAKRRAGPPLVVSRRGGSDGRNTRLTAAGRRRLAAVGLTGVAGAFDAHAGVTPVRVGRRTLFVAGRVPMGAVGVQVPPEAVVLHRRPSAGSARNEIPMRVVGVSPVAEGVYRVRLGAGSLQLESRVTRGALDELGIRKGSRLVASIKAVAVRVDPLTEGRR